MARVVAFIPDLLFGSSVTAALQGAGHEVSLAGDRGALERQFLEADVLIVDLTADPATRIAEVERVKPSAVPILAFYSHVEADVRAQGQDAGFELVVPRSRMAREAPALVERLLAEA